MYTKEEYLSAKSFIENADTKLVLAYVFWFLFGGLGVHRLILGKITSGIIMFFLFIIGILGSLIIIGIPILIGVCIWWFLDAYFIYKIIEDKKVYSQMIINEFGFEKNKSAD